LSVENILQVHELLYVSGVLPEIYRHIILNITVGF